MSPTTATVPAAPGLQLPRERRLLRKVDYQVVYARGRRQGDAIFGISYLVREPPGPARIGLSVGVKVAGNAVQRNRIRRTIRESFRLAQHRLGGLDVVVTARSGARELSNARLRDSLDAQWSRLARQCSAPYKS